MKNDNLHDLSTFMDWWSDKCAKPFSIPFHIQPDTVNRFIEKYKYANLVYESYTDDEDHSTPNFMALFYSPYYPVYTLHRKFKIHTIQDHEEYGGKYTVTFKHIFSEEEFQKCKYYKEDTRERKNHIEVVEYPQERLKEKDSLLSISPYIFAYDFLNLKEPTDIALSLQFLKNRHNILQSLRVLYIQNEESYTEILKASGFSIVDCVPNVAYPLCMDNIWAYDLGASTST